MLHEGQWYIQGCLDCVWTEGCTARSSQSCPNGCEHKIVRFPAVVDGWRMLEACRVIYRMFITEREARYSREALERTFAGMSARVQVDA